MKERIRILPTKALVALSLVLGFSPVFLLLGARFLPERPALWYLLPLGALIWGCIGYFFPSKGRLAFSLAGCAGLTGIGFLLVADYDSISAFLPMLPCMLLLMMMLPAWARPAWDEWPLAIWISGIVVHLALQIFGKLVEWTNLSQVFSLCFAGYMFLFLMMMNRHGLREGMHGSRKAPAAMRRRNQWLLIALFIPAALAACWGLLGRWLDAIWNGLKNVIGAVVAWFFSLLESDTLVMTEGPMEMPENQMAGLAEAAGEPSRFSRIMEIALIVFACIIALVAVGFVFWFLGKKFLALLARIRAYLRQFAKSSMEDYVDELESTLDMDEKAKLFKEKLIKTFLKPRQIPWNELSGRERVRRLYQQFLQKHPNAQGMTAREAIAEQGKYSAQQADAFSLLYEKARYSDHPIAEGEADQLRHQIK